MSLLPVGIATLVGTPIASALMGHNHIWWKGLLFSTVTILGAAVAAGCTLATRRRGMPLT